jgi:hypothetical protein
MDYKKLYTTLCDYCKTTDVRTRIAKRNSADPRLLDSKIYTERHHIVPRHSHGSNNISNLVDLLPEEHALAHLIRYKAFKDRNDYLAVRFIINGVNNKPLIFTEETIRNVNKVAKLRKLSDVAFRQQTGWHTEAGRKAISEARKGFISAFDLNGNFMATVPTDHEKILSGEWGHHSRGKCSVLDSSGNKLYVPVEEYHANRHMYTSNTGNVAGSNNPTYLGITDTELVQLVVDYCNNFVHLGYIPSYGRALTYYTTKGTRIPKSFSSFRFNGQGVKKLMELVSLSLSTPINAYPRGKLLAAFNQIDKDLLC